MGSWDLGRVERLRRIPAREYGGGLGVARRKKRKAGGGKGFGSGFIGEHGLVQEREREGQSRARLRMVSGAGVPLGCMVAARHRRPDVAARGTASGGSTGGERSGGATRGRGNGGADLQQLGKWPAAAGHARATEAGEVGDSGKTMEDPNSKSRKAKDPTVMDK
jgi:hypothetical protein